MVSIVQPAERPLEVNQTGRIGLPVPANFDLDRWSRSLDSRDIHYTVTNGRLRWLKNYALLHDLDRSVIREYRDEIKRRIIERRWPLPPEPEAQVSKPHATSDVPPAASAEQEEPEPEVWVYGQRVTEADVDECFSRLDEKTQRDRERGWITKREAYQMTRAWLRQQQELF